MNIPMTFAQRQSIWLCSPFFVVFVAGCSTFSDLKPPIQPLPSTAQSEKRRKESEGYKSLARNLEKLDAKTLKAYIDALSSPNSSVSITRTGSVKLVTATQLVVNHPAWLLADRLEKGGIFPLPARNLSISPRPGGASIEAFADEENAVTRTIASQKLSTQRAPASLEKVQSDALDSFNNAWNDRQVAIRSSEESLRIRELEDKIREDTRAQVRAIALQGVPSDIALELSNLRLQLLRNLAVAPSQREAAKKRIAEIEENLRKIWKEQTELQERLLNESLGTSPQKQRTEGMEKIRAAMHELAEQDALEREKVLREIESLIGTDFNRAKNLSLTLFLPPAIVPQEIRTNFFEQRASGETSGADVSARSQNPIPAQNPSQKLADVGPVSREEIGRLRQLALKDATIWAQAANQLERAGLEKPSNQSRNPSP